MQTLAGPADPAAGRSHRPRPGLCPGGPGEGDAPCRPAADPAIHDDTVIRPPAGGTACDHSGAVALVCAEWHLVARFSTSDGRAAGRPGYRRAIRQDVHGSAGWEDNQDCSVLFRRFRRSAGRSRLRPAPVLRPDERGRGVRDGWRSRTGWSAGGLIGIQPVNSEPHAALVEAIGSMLTGSGWQRCRPLLSAHPAQLRPQSAQLRITWELVHHSAGRDRGGPFDRVSCTQRDISG
jgi:hypothetical protein